MSLADCQRIGKAAVDAALGEAAKDAVNVDMSRFAIVVVVQQLGLDVGAGVPAVIGTNITGPKLADDVERVLQTGLKGVRERRGRS